MKYNYKLQKGGVIDASAVAVMPDAKLRAVQLDLKNKGLYSGTVDGKYGPKTEAAINAYNLRSKGLTLPEFTVVSTNDPKKAETLASLEYLQKIEKHPNILEVWEKSGKPAIDIDINTKRAHYIPFNNTAYVGSADRSYREKVLKYKKAEDEMRELALSGHKNVTKDKLKKIAKKHNLESSYIDTIDDLYVREFKKPYSDLYNQNNLDGYGSRRGEIIAELSHGVQNQKGDLSVSRGIKDWFESPYYDGQSQKKQYTTKGTAEHEAHKIIEPQLKRLAKQSGTSTIDVGRFYPMNASERLEQFKQEDIDTERRRETTAKYEHGGKTQLGYKRNSPYKNNPFIDIESNSITMQDVDKMLLLQPDGDPPVVAPPNSGEYYFPNSTKVRETPMKHGGFVSKWLGVYQEGGPIPLDLNKLSKEEYAKLYNEGRVATYDKQSDAYQPPVLPEVTVSAKAPKSFEDFFDRYDKKKTTETTSLAQAMFAAPAEYLMGLPQAATTYLLDSEKNLEPSKALGIENKWGAMATDMVLDPTNLVGAGLLGKGKAVAAIAASKESGLLSKAHKLNPLAFKPDADSYYRIVGRDAVNDALESGVIRSKASQDVVQSGINLGARPTAFPSFSKGKISTEYANGLPDHGLIETTRPMKASTLGRHGKGTTQFPVDDSGQYMKEFPLEDAKIYEKDWLRGYKEISKSAPVTSKTEYQVGGQVNNFISKWLT